MLISNYITPVMNTDSNGYMAESALLIAVGSSNPVGWIILGVYVAVLITALVVSTADIGTMDGFTEVLDSDEEVATNTDAIAIANTKSKTEPTYIYRGGSNTFYNLTPKPWKDYDGLSYYLYPPATGNYTVTTIEAVNATGFLTAVINGANHVSVRPTDGSKLNEWMMTVDHANISPHFYSIILRSISWKGGYI